MTIIYGFPNKILTTFSFFFFRYVTFLNTSIIKFKLLLVSEENIIKFKEEKFKPTLQFHYLERIMRSPITKKYDKKKKQRRLFFDWLAQ
jgi:hypothetical protein